jgi:hypothetical protein
LPTSAALFAHLAGEGQLKIVHKGEVPNNATVERERRFLCGSKCFFQAKWIGSARSVKILISQMN